MKSTRLLSVRLPSADYEALEALVQAQRAAGKDVSISTVVQKHISQLATLIRSLNGNERKE